MTTWPNWVDLIIIIALLRTCYNGFGRGLWAELLNLIGALSITALTMNYAGVVTSWLGPWLSRLNPTVIAFLLFWMLFLSLLALAHVVIRQVAGAIKWERLHWATGMTGLALGGLRGLWWSGVLLVALTSSGFAGLRASVEERSVVGPHLLPLARQSLAYVSDQFPGAQHRSETLIPPANPKAPKPK